MPNMSGYNKDMLPVHVYVEIQNKHYTVVVENMGYIYYIYIYIYIYIYKTQIIANCHHFQVSVFVSLLIPCTLSGVECTGFLQYVVVGRSYVKLGPSVAYHLVQ